MRLSPAKLFVPAVLAGLLLFAPDAGADSAQLYLDNVPQIKGKICDRSVDRNQFNEEMQKFMARLDKEIKLREKAANQAMKAQKDASAKATLAKAGFAGTGVPTDGHKLSAEEKRQLMDKMMKDKSGMSMASTGFNAAGKQNDLGLREAAVQKRLGEPVAEVELDSKVRDAELEAGGQPDLAVRMPDLTNADALANLNKQIELAQINATQENKKKKTFTNCRDAKRAEEKYCEVWTTKYAQALVEEKRRLPGAFQEFAAIEKEEKKTWKALYGMEPAPEIEGLRALKAVQAYATDVANYYSRWPKLDCVGEP